MATPTAKSFVEKRASTDEMIFKSALKRMYGLNAEQMLSYWPTVQNTSEIIKPDGTIALNDEDIRLVTGTPLRTQTGVLEYKEDTPSENFPLRIPLETIKYDAKSFLAATDTAFEEYTLGNIRTLDSYQLPSVNVIDNLVQEDVPSIETIIVDFNSPAESKNKTATEEYGEAATLLTAINSSGASTGVGGLIWMTFKGIRYRLGYTTAEDGYTTAPGDLQIFPPYKMTNQIAGLTNTIAGRNLEVFMKDRGLDYTDVQIVPAATINQIPLCKELIDYFNVPGDGPTITSEINWGAMQADGYSYNTNALIYNDILYEPGDMILPDGTVLPDQSARWTDYHPYDLNKPALRSHIYTPSGEEVITKEWEGKLIRGYTSMISSGYFMVIGGGMRKAVNENGLFSQYALLKNLPLRTKADEGPQPSAYHNITYTILDWNDLKQLGTPSNRQAFKTNDAESEVVTIYEGPEQTGPSMELPIGIHSPSGSTRRVGSEIFNDAPRGVQFTEDVISSINIPIGLGISIYEQVGSDLHTNAASSPFSGDDFAPRSFQGPSILDFSVGGVWDKYDNSISAIRVYKSSTDYINAPSLTINQYKDYIRSGNYYQKPHLAKYNQLFE